MSKQEMTANEKEQHDKSWLHDSANDNGWYQWSVTASSGADVCSAYAQFYAGGFEDDQHFRINCTSWSAEQLKVEREKLDKLINGLIDFRDAFTEMTTPEAEGDE